MAPPDDHRRAADRRRQARGGRRRGDVRGYAPMVFVIDEDTRRREICEAILAKLRFAVAPFESVEKAISVMRALRPEVVVAREEHIERLRATLPLHDAARGMPLVPITDDHHSGEALVEDIRRALQARAPA
jgi:DNA-binding NtrC family response regulator